MEALLKILESWGDKVPVTFYVSVGGFIEEIIAPIPSPLIMTSAGTLVHDQGHAAFYIVIISLLAALGKTLGSVIIYLLSDKAEDLVLVKYGKFFGNKHKDIESIGKRFNNTWKDDVLLAVLRAIPILPGTPVSVVCGLIKLNMRTFIQSTFIGVWIRSMIFGFIGFYGKSQLGDLIMGAEGIVDILLIFAVFIAAILFVYKKKDMLEKLVLKRIFK